MNYTIDNGSITYVPLFNRSNDKLRSWTLAISLFDDKDTLVPIHSVEMEIGKGHYCKTVSTYGYVGMKMTVSAPTITRSGKNIGKANATTPLTQAISEATSKYNLKCRSGYAQTAPDADTPAQAATASATQVPFPMALSVYKNQKKKIVYPVFVQPKLDGVRMVALLNDKGEVYLSSRRHKEIHGFDDLKKALSKVLTPGLIIDGEMYQHGMNLQDISGIVRSESNTKDKISLSFYVFDCFTTITSPTDSNLLQPNSPFKERIKYLTKILKKGGSKHIVLTETTTVDDEESGDQYFYKKLEEKYEGIVYKNADRPYEFSFDREKRSLYNLKRKAAFDSEFKIVGFEEGNGKDRGCVIFVCETEIGIKFNSVPNGDYAYRAWLYQDCLANFDTKYKNQYCKMYYEDLSKQGVPLRCRIIQVLRDMSFD